MANLGLGEVCLSGLWHSFQESVNVALLDTATLAASGCEHIEVHVMLTRVVANRRDREDIASEDMGGVRLLWHVRIKWMWSTCQSGRFRMLRRRDIEDRRDKLRVLERSAGWGI